MGFDESTDSLNTVSGSEEKAESSELSRDILTGLPMRNHLEDKLLTTMRNALEHKKTFALGMFGFGNYHHLQSIYGADKVDQIIRSSTDRISQEIDTGETLYRFDHDGLAIVFDKTIGKTAVEKRFSNFRTYIVNILDANGMESDILRELCYIDSPYSSAEQIINSCLAAMYGKNTFKPKAKNIDATSKKLTKNDFTEAIKNSNFFCFYQPIYDLRKDKLIGVEILVRLNYKREGILLPEEFLPQAIECNMMTEVTAHILDTVLSQKSFWATQMNQDLNITINIGIADIHSRIFMEMLEKKISEYNTDPTKLTIEISEDVLEQDYEAVYEEYRMLDKLGVKLSIDHFGKNCITLQHVSKLPLHSIKIDGSIIEGMPGNEEKIRLASGIISLGRKLGLEVGATFVDSSTTKIMLGRIGCNFAQGYYLGKAVPAFEITDLMHNS